MAGGPSMPADDELDRTPVVDGPRGSESAPADAGGFDLGQRLGRYVLRRRLGEGGMGVVYEAHDAELDRPVAIKVLWPGTGSERRAARLRREAQVMARLNHPGIVKVFDVGTQGDQVWLAMELVDGSNLRQWLRAGERSAEEVLATMVRAGEGLWAAHEAGVVHRDFKPTNILVSGDGRVLVSDFGLARLAKEEGGGDSTGTGDVAASHDDGMVDTAGTPSYMAPEQHTGGSIDARADQYAFCVTLWEAFTRQRPFAGRTAAAMLQEKRAKRVRRPTNTAMPRKVSAACLRGLSPDPVARWPTMRPLLDALQAKAGLSLSMVVGAIGCAAALLALVASQDEPAPCAVARQAMAQTWDEDARERTSQALRATDLAYAPQTAASVAEGIDRHVARWLELHKEACVTDLPREGIEARRIACLEKRRDELAALAILEVRLGTTHPRLAPIVANLGWVLHGEGQHAAARLQLERAKQLYRDAHGSEHGTVAVTTVRLAEVDLALGRVHEAEQALRWALPRLGNHERERFGRGDARFALARARAEKGAGRGELEELVEAALEDYRAVGGPADRERMRAQEWLRSELDAAGPGDG